MTRLRDMLRHLEPDRALTPAEGRLLPLLGEGMSYSEIASELGISPLTVKAHVANIARKLPGDGDPRHRVGLYAVRLAAEAEVAARLAEARVEPAHAA